MPAGSSSSIPPGEKLARASGQVDAALRRNAITPTGPDDPNFGYHVLAKARLDATRDYIKQGRRFQHESVEDLQQRFIRCVHQWADFPEDVAGRADLRDVGAEYDLRGIEEPYELVRPQLALINQHTQAFLKTGSKAALDELADRAIADYKASIASKN